MILYLCIIGFSWLILSILNCVFGNYNVGYVEIVGLILLAIVLSIIIDGICALFVRAIKVKEFNYNNTFFKEKKFERKFYEKLKIRAWKDKIPELGKTLKFFDKTKVQEKASSDYLMGFINETCIAELMHTLSLFCAFLLLIFLPKQYFWGISFPVCIINFFLQIPPIIVQRYNRPKLLLAYKRTKRNEQVKNQNNVCD